MTQQVTVTPTAIMARINRVLGKNGQALRRARPNSCAQMDYGRFYILRTIHGFGGGRPGVVRKNVDFEALARELGALKEWESFKSGAVI